jgi:hypothetical protein
VIHSIAKDRLLRHKPDTSAGSNASTLEIELQATTQIPIGLRFVAPISGRLSGCIELTLEVLIMKSLVQAVVVAAALVAPLASFAQSNQPLTRAQVRAELVQLEKAGYSPGASADAYYPRDIQAAEARVAAQNDAAHDVGGTPGGSSVSGAPAVAAHAETIVGLKPVYFGQ